jgi:hypothetical protein
MSDDWKQMLGGLFFLLAIVLMVLLAINQWGCVPAGSGKPAAYEAELIACNQTSSTLAESINCEDRVRKAYGRPPRDAGGD